MDDAVVMPFADGERLVYEVSLLGITAGSAELRVEGGDDGEWRLHATGRTVGATDSIFGIRQSASCTVQGEALKPEVCLFTSRQRKGMKRREVRYDPATGDVRERVLEDGKRSDKTRNFGDEGVQEAVSGDLPAAQRFPAEGETMSFRAIRKGKAITVEAEALGTERVVTPAGSFEARVVESAHHHEGGQGRGAAREGLVHGRRAAHPDQGLGRRAGGDPAGQADRRFADPGPVGGRQVGFGPPSS